MASAAFTYAGSRPLPASTASPWFAGTIILGTIVFNAALCLLNTRGFPINGPIVMLSEVVLIGGAVLACRNYLNAVHLTVLTLIVLYTVALSSVKFVDAQGFDPKIARDLMIPVVFFVMGRAVENVRAADRIVLGVTVLLLVFAAFEYFALSSFLQVFDVAQYYVARGTIAATELNPSQGLMVSGMRPTDQGRTLLPFLGDHRVSSLFLEPSTLGNFGALITLWAIVRTRMEGRLYLFCALGGLTLLALSDTRFAGFLVLIGLVTMMVPPRITTPAVIVLPFVTMFALLALAGWAEPYHGAPSVDGRSIYERVLYSGRVLQSFDIYNWFGLRVSRVQTFDSGYAYLVSNIGIVGFVLIWTLFMSIKGRSQFYYLFRNVIAVCFCALLCISASPFTIKLAAMLWFLLGVLSVAVPERRPARRAQAPSRSPELRWRGSPTADAPQLSSWNIVQT